MKLPSLAKFMDMKDPRDRLGPPKAGEINRDNLPTKEMFLVWEKAMPEDSKKVFNSGFVRAVTIIGILLGILFLFMQEFALILVVGSIILFLSSLDKMSFSKVRYEVSNHGILVGDDLYFWDVLRRYYFAPRGVSDEVIVVDTVLGIPGKIYLPFNKEDKSKIMEIFDKYLNYLEEEPKTVFDNAYDKVVGMLGVEEVPQDKK
jgi:hypothetical protein